MINTPGFTTSAHTLPNGLLVLAREVHHAPIATCWIWYRVGSRHETRGGAGLSHWVEHLLFNGTPRIPKGMIKRLIARYGGISNGFTANDYTAYFATVPSDRIDLVLQIEADRMVNTQFDPDDVEHERKVIIAERAGYENAPTWWLREAVLATAFQIHPYRNPVIGATRDLQAITRDDLERHYQTYYQPQNAVLVLVGDFATGTIMRQVEHAFAGVPVGPPLPPAWPIEPAQQEQRRTVVHRPGPTPYVQLVYHTPDCRHPDFASLLLLDAILSGAKSPSFSTGAPTHCSARLYRALVETQLATIARSSYYPTHDPRLFELIATVQDGCMAATVEAALIGEIERIQQDGVSEMELLTVRKQLRALLAYAGERVASQARLLGMWAMLDSYTRGERLLDELRAVRADDVRQVAQTYLVERHRTIGHFLPAQR
jgi:zinc protease